MITGHGFLKKQLYNMFEIVYHNFEMAYLSYSSDITVHFFSSQKYELEFVKEFGRKFQLKKLGQEKARDFLHL